MERRHVKLRIALVVVLVGICALAMSVPAMGIAGRGTEWDYIGVADNSPAGYSTSRVLAEAPCAVSLESLGCPNPGNASVLITATPGSAAFVKAVREARSQGKIVFAFANPSTLVSALPDHERSVNAAWLNPETSQTGPIVTSYYRTANGLPVLDILVLPLFEGSDEELLASAEFRNHLAYVDEFCRSHNFNVRSRDMTDIEVAALSSAVEALSADEEPRPLFAAASSYSCGFVNLSASYPTAGRMHMSTEAVFVYGDTNPSKDWYLLSSWISMGSGQWIWNSGYQKDYHRLKFAPYNYDGPVWNPVYTPRSIIQGSPGSTPSGGSVSVSVSTSGVGVSYSYPLVDITCTAWLSSIPSEVKWQHTFVYDTASAIYDNSQAPAYIEEVPQGKYCKVYTVGTANWHRYFGIDDYTVNNIYNMVMMWAHP